MDGCVWFCISTWSSFRVSVQLLYSAVGLENTRFWYQLSIPIPKSIVDTLILFDTSINFTAHKNKCKMSPQIRTHFFFLSIINGTPLGATPQHWLQCYLLPSKVLTHLLGPALHLQCSSKVVGTLTQNCCINLTELT